MTFPARRICMVVNGEKVGPVVVPEELSMLDFLHEHLELTGTRYGCGSGQCAACVVILDNPDGTSETRQTCLAPALLFDGCSIRTVEAHATLSKDGKSVKLSPVQGAFLAHFAFQCGYCTPGFVNAATVLVEGLRLKPIARDDLEEAVETALAPHLCRCTGYIRYYEALRDLILATPGLTQAL